MVSADIWAAVGGVGSVLAAVAAAVAVWFAKATVYEARTARREDQRAHQELLTSHQAQLEVTAAAHRDAVAQHVQARSADQELLASHREQLNATTLAHQDEARQRAEAFEADRRLAVVRQLQHLATSLLALADCARDETITPPEPLSEISVAPLTRIPGLLATLLVAVGALRALDGPDIPLTDQLAHQRCSPGGSKLFFVGDAVSGLEEIALAMSTIR
jgi:hypothetical protein